MGYQPFTNNYTSPDPNRLAAIYARQANRRAQINAQMTSGNQVLGALTTECCSDPAYGGNSWIGGGDPSTDPTVTSAAIASLVPGTPASTAVQPITGTAGSTPSSAPLTTGPLTPVDILTGTRGWRMQQNGKPWPHPRMTRGQQRRLANQYPDYGPTVALRSLVPDCPCFFSSASPVAIAVPALTTPAPNPTPAPSNIPVPAASACPYPNCSTGNVCLDLVTGCVSNSQVDPAQVLACTKAGYGTFGNSGVWLSPIMLGCGGNLPWLGTPLPNPPQASGSMSAQLTAAINAGSAAARQARGLSGLGQDDGTSNVGGFLAVMAMFGIVVWAIRK